MINWKTGKIEWEKQKPNMKKIIELTRKRYGLLDSTTPIPSIQKAFIEEIPDQEEHLNGTRIPLEEDKEAILIELLETERIEETWIRKTNVATQLATEENKKKQDKPIKELVPEEFHEYLDVFDEEKANRFPME